MIESKFLLGGHVHLLCQVGRSSVSVLSVIFLFGSCSVSNIFLLFLFLYVYVIPVLSVDGISNHNPVGKPDPFSRRYWFEGSVLFTG